MVALSTAQSHPALLIRFLDYSAL